jgi:cyclohexyl-isocyanide hydratase
MNGIGLLRAESDAEHDRSYLHKNDRAYHSGSLLLGAAGLLQGYKATSHWAAREGLSAFGAEPTDARVVVDRNRITGGGVTAGIDFGLVVLAKLRGDDAAKFTQLAMEYDPEPPFNSGSPKTADPAIVQQTLSTMAIYMKQLASNPGTVSRVE